MCVHCNLLGPRALVGPLYLRGVHYSSLRETLESKISRILKAIRKINLQHAGNTLVVNQQLNLPEL